MNEQHNKLNEAWVRIQEQGPDWLSDRDDRPSSDGLELLYDNHSNNRTLIVRAGRENDEHSRCLVIKNAENIQREHGILLKLEKQQQLGLSHLHKVSGVYCAYTRRNIKPVKFLLNHNCKFHKFEIHHLLDFLKMLTSYYKDYKKSGENLKLLGDLNLENIGLIDRGGKKKLVVFDADYCPADANAKDEALRVCCLFGCLLLGEEIEFCDRKKIIKEFEDDLSNAGPWITDEKLRQRILEVVKESYKQLKSADEVNIADWLQEFCKKLDLVQKPRRLKFLVGGIAAMFAVFAVFAFVPDVFAELSLFFTHSTQRNATRGVLHRLSKPDSEKCRKVLPFELRHSGIVHKKGTLCEVESPRTPHRSPVLVLKDGGYDVVRISNNGSITARDESTFDVHYKCPNWQAKRRLVACLHSE